MKEQKKQTTKVIEKMSLGEKLEYIKGEMLEAQRRYTSYGDKFMKANQKGDTRMEYMYLIDAKTEKSKLNILEEEFNNLINEIQ